MILKDRSAIVTGASRGIGRAIALKLAQEGCSVLVNYFSAQDAAEEVAATARKSGSAVRTFRADVRNLEQVQAMTRCALDAFGKIDILINNAGIARDNFVTFMKEEEWNEVLDTNLKGAFHCIKAVGRGMLQRRYGRIVNISSDAGLTGDLMRSNYAAAKAGLIGLTKTVAREFASSGITVNAVAPGLVETEMTVDMPAARRSKLRESIPQRRFGQPEEIAEVAAFLSSDAAAYLTGQVVSVDGGLLI